MRIGLIAKNQEEGEIVKSLLSKDHQVYVFTRPIDPEGMILDTVIETVGAKENKHYDLIKAHAEPCTL